MGESIAAGESMLWLSNAPNGLFHHSSGGDAFESVTGVGPVLVDADTLGLVG